jgi:hypothetical protein
VILDSFLAIFLDGFLDVFLDILRPIFLVSVSHFSIFRSKLQSRLYNRLSPPSVRVDCHVRRRKILKLEFIQ